MDKIAAMQARYAYILFQSPGPSPADEGEEVKAVLARLATEYRHDFSNCRVRVVRKDSLAPDDYDKVTLGILLLLRLNEGTDAGFKIFRVRLSVNDERYTWAQVAWASS